MGTILAQLLDEDDKTLCALFSLAGCHEPKSVAKWASFLLSIRFLNTAITVVLAKYVNSFITK